jgi:hypothetical protein
VEVIVAETQFEGSGPVARYWLANCKGFAVEGGARGVVEDLIRDGDPFVTTRLVVRRRGRRRGVIPVTAVASIDPAERVLVVEPRRSEGSSRQPPRIRRGFAGARSPVGPAAATARRALFAAGAAAAPRLRAAGTLAREATGRGVDAGRVAAAAIGRRAVAPAARTVARSFVLLADEAAGTAKMLRRPPRRARARSS